MQLVELQHRYEELDALGWEFVAVALEEERLEDTGKIVSALEEDLRFPLLADPDRSRTEAFQPTTVYLLDAEGVVRQVFPMLTYARGSWDAVLREGRRVLGE